MSKLPLCAGAALALMLGAPVLAQTPPPTTPPAQSMTPTQPSTPPSQAPTPATPPAAQSVATGMTVKDNTGVAIGQITDLKPDASGAQLATVKMGEDSFTVAATALAVQNGAAVINLTQAQLQAQVHKPKA